MVWFLLIVYAIFMVAYGAIRQYRVKTRYRHDYQKCEIMEWFESPTLQDALLIIIYPVPVAITILKESTSLTIAFVKWLFGRTN